MKTTVSKPTASLAADGPPRRTLRRFKALRAGLFARSTDAGLRSPRFWLLAMGHLALFGLIFWSAYLLRFDFAVPDSLAHTFWLSLPWVMGVKLVVFYASGHYHGWWRYVTFADLMALMRASLVSLLAMGAMDHFVRSFTIPRGVLVLDLLISIVVLGSLRASWRLAREQFRAIFGRTIGSARW